MGLDVYLVKGKEEILVDDSIYPNHLFKIGYFRSSYNEAGYNSLMNNIGLSGLYEIFSVNRGQRISINWKKSLENAKNTLNALHERALNNEDFLVFPMALHTEIHSENIFDTFMSEYHKCKDSDYNSWMNRNGYFFKKPISIHGIMKSKIFGIDGLYIIHRDDDNYKWLIEATEIVIRTCEYVLDHPANERRKFKFIWSS